MDRKRTLGMTRRQFLQTGMLAGAGLLIPGRWNAGPGLTPRLGPGIPGTRRTFAPAIAGGTLQPGDVNKFVQPLIKPPAMPSLIRDIYDIAVRQFQQQILSAPHPQTTVWGYGSIWHPGTVAEGGTFHYPSFTIETRYRRPVLIKWTNGLVDQNGNYLPHLLPVDPTLHWANPPGGLMGRDMRPEFTETPGPYTGPVPIVTHVHGAHTTQESDGYPEAWFLPAANNIPAGYATTGTFYDYFKNLTPFKPFWQPGMATFSYPNDQRATTLWYHDHTLGMTRLNVYAGPAGFYLIRGGPSDQVVGTLPGPAPSVGSNPFGEYGEIPIAIQDRSFNADGSLFYPDSRTFFDGFPGPYIPGTPVPPIWNPEFFGNMMVVNGQTWPYLNVQRKRYRFRFLNGCNSRFLLLKMTTGPRTDNESFNTPEGTFWQIGAEGGFLPAPVELDQLLMGPAERADCIVDFSQFPVGAEVYLVNDGPDAPFGGITTEEISDWESTGLVMKFIVGEGPATDPSTHPSGLGLPAISRLGSAATTRGVSLNEEVLMPEDVPFAALLGHYDRATGMSMPMMWMDPITENPRWGATEVWEIYNLTMDAHPIHVHLVQFEVVDRQSMVTDEEGMSVHPGQLIPGTNRPPEAWETGFKDTVIAYPGEVTRIKARFSYPGLYVWHCHIVEHEDNEMMRPYYVGPIPPNLPAHEH